jgi:hypothetical protein
MVIVGKVLSVSRVADGDVLLTEIKVDLGNGDNRRPRSVWLPPGYDGNPLPGDFALMARTDTSGRLECFGFIDPKNVDLTKPGEARVYSRDSEGTTVAEAHLKDDGTISLFNSSGNITLDPDGRSSSTNAGGVAEHKADGSFKATNASGSFELQAGGTFEANGVTISPTGAAVFPNSLILNGKEIDGHDHNITGGSSAPGPTAGNN